MMFYSLSNDQRNQSEGEKESKTNTDSLFFVSSISAPLMPNGLPATRATLQTQREITIANDLIGCIIGRGGQKISEIR